MTPASNSTDDKAPGNAGGYVVGVDIGGTNVRVALADAKGVTLSKWSTSTVTATEPTAVVRLIREGVDALLRDLSLPSRSLCAMAAGAPGITNVDDGVVIATSYLMGWRDVPLRDLLQDEFRIPVSIDNDVNLAAIGEFNAGAAKGISDFVFLAIGTGIGAGIVLNGQVHRGSNWTAGEIGYMLVPGTPVNPVQRGEPGALEGFVGGEGIKLQWQRAWSESRTALPRDAKATQILDHSLAGNPLALEISQAAARILAYAIYNMSLVLNCPLFVLGGTVGLHPALGDAARQILSDRRARVEPKLICSVLGAEAQLAGAICVAIETSRKSLVPIQG